MYVRTDGKYPCVVQNIVPFGAAAQKQRFIAIIWQQRDEMDNHRPCTPNLQIVDYSAYMHATILFLSDPIH